MPIAINSKPELSALGGAAARAEFSAYWPLVLGAFLGVMCGMSGLFYYTQGLFIKPIAAEFGWSRSVWSAGSLIAVATTAALSPLCGAVIDRFGARVLVTCSMLGFAFSLWLLSQLNGSVPQYFLFMAVLSLCACGTTPLSFSRVVNERFVSARGLALGIVGAGGGVGATVAPRVVSAIVQAEGWRQGFIQMAGFVVIMTPLIWWLLRAPTTFTGDARVQQWSGLSSAQALRSTRLWILAAMLMLAAMGASAVIVHFVPMLTDAGLSASRAASYAGLIGAAVIVSRVVAGALMDWMFAPRLAAVVFSIAAVGAAILAYSGASMAMLGALLMGTALGTESDLTAYLVARYFGMRAFGVIYGCMYAAFMMGIALGPLFAGAVFDHTHSYELALYGSASMFILAALLSTGLGSFPAFAAEPAA